MLKSTLVWVTVILFVGVVPVSAMSGGHGSSGGCSAAAGHGSMHNQMNDVMGNGANEGMHGGHWQSMHQDGQHIGAMDGQTAETMMRRYMDNKNIYDSWHFGPQMDHGDYYMSDIIGSNGEVVDRLVIDKKSGNVHSVEHR